MSVGLEIRNPQGKICIDENFLNYVLTKSGQASLVVNPYITSTGIIPFEGNTTAVNPPVVAIKMPENDSLYCLGCKHHGAPNAWTGFELFFACLSGAVSISFQYKIFTQVPSKSNGYGLQVFHENGDVIFDSSYSPMALSGILIPQDWQITGTESPYIGVRRSYYQQPLTTRSDYIVVSMCMFGDLAYPNGVEGATPVALVGYGYGYGTNGYAKMLLIMQTFSTATPNPLSTPRGYAISTVPA